MTAFSVFGRVKLALTTVGTVVLLGHMPAIARMSGAAADASTFGDAQLGELPVQLVVHAAGGLTILLAATILSIYKPWGRTNRRRRLQA